MTITPITRTFLLFFFFNDPSTTEIYTLSLHDALPILRQVELLHRQRFRRNGAHDGAHAVQLPHDVDAEASVLDRKSTRLNSSHSQISYAVFCLKKKRYSC